MIRFAWIAALAALHLGCTAGVEDMPLECLTGAAPCDGGSLSSIPTKVPPLAVDPSAGRSPVTGTMNPDAGAPDAGVPTADSNVVRGTALARNFVGKGLVVVPRLSPTLTVKAWVQNGSNWSSYDGKMELDGTFSIPNVPPNAEMYVRLGADYLFSNHRSFDFDRYGFGRPGAALAQTNPTNLTLNAKNAVPWKDSDCLQITSLSAGVRFYVDNVPLGEKELANFNINFADGKRPLIDESRGDTVEVSQLIADSQPGYLYCSLKKSFTASGVKMENGRGATVSGTFVDVPQQSVTIDWRRSAFANYRDIAAPDVQSTESEVYLRALPEGATRGVYSAGPNLVSHFNTSTSDITMNLTFGNPFPNTDVVAEMWTVFLRSYTASGASKSITREAGIWIIDNLAGISGKPVRPRITPVRNVRINGNSAFSPRRGVGRNPTLSWDAPEVGTANLYIVTLYRLRADGEASVVDTVGTIYTEKSRLTLPPEMLSANEDYFALIVARQEATRSITTPLRTSANAGRADVLTNTFRP